MGGLEVVEVVVVAEVVDEVATDGVAVVPSVMPSS